jgi:hypothetical protein
MTRAPKAFGAQLQPEKSFGQQPLVIQHLAIEGPKLNVRKILDTTFYPVAPANQIDSQSRQA